jgi:hypothetical protein
MQPPARASGRTAGPRGATGLRRRALPDPLSGGRHCRAEVHPLGLHFSDLTVWLGKVLHLRRIFEFLPSTGVWFRRLVRTPLGLLTNCW